MWRRAQSLIGSARLRRVAAVAPAASGVARLAHHHRVRQRAGRARPHDPVARRAGAVRPGAVLRHRRLRGRADRPLRRLRDVFVLVAVARGRGRLVAFLVGFLLARYRDIFFAMLSLAMSMILYGVLVKTETLGSTDGFHVECRTCSSATRRRARRCTLALFWLVLGFSRARRLAGRALFPHRRRRARGADARQRDPRRVSRRLGQPPDPPQARDLRRAGRRRRRAGGARDRACRSQHGVLDDVGRLRVRDHPGRHRLGRGGVRRLVPVRAGALDRRRSPARHLADHPRLGAAADHPVPARGPRLAVHAPAASPEAAA